MAERQTVVRRARVIDGTGAPWYRGDVLIDGARIAAIGHNLSAGAGAVVVDASERYLAPGFIDAHCHDDLIFQALQLLRGACDRSTPPLADRRTASIQS